MWLIANRVSVERPEPWRLKAVYDIPGEHYLIDRPFF